MTYYFKLACISGLLGVVIMFAMWFKGIPPTHLWLLVFWPSQIVGMGTDRVEVFPETIMQFVLYSVLGLTIGAGMKVVRHLRANA